MKKKCLMILKLAAHETPNPNVSPLAAVVTHKVRTIVTFRSTHRTETSED